MDGDLEHSHGFTKFPVICVYRSFPRPSALSTLPFLLLISQFRGANVWFIAGFDGFLIVAA